MTFAQLIDSWTAVLGDVADIFLFLAGLVGIALVFRSLMRAHTAVNEGQSASRHYVAAGIGGALTAVGLIAGALSRLVVT